MVALTAVLAARICAEALRVVQVIAPAADVGYMHIRAVAQRERRQFFARNVGEMQAHVVFAAVRFNLFDAALFGGFVAVFRQRIVKIAVSEIMVDEEQAPILLAVLRGEVAPPHEQQSRRIVADFPLLRLKIGQQAGQVFPL